MRARHNTVCIACRKPVLVGQTIRRAAKNDGPYIHVDCRRRPKSNRQLRLF